MEDLIKALTIFSKYTDSEYPTHCEHDALHVNVSFEDVSNEDKELLVELSFVKSEYGIFRSYRFGSC